MGWVDKHRLTIKQGAQPVFKRADGSAPARFFHG